MPDVLMPDGLRVLFVVNPAAGGGRPARLVQRVSEQVEAAGAEVRLVRTEGPGHARQLARDAAPWADVVVAVGGDGTVNEVATGLLDVGDVGSDGAAAPALSVIPAGTGNDFARAAAFGYAPERLADGLTRPGEWRLDAGRVRWTDEAGRQGTAWFVNALGAGLDAEVAHDARQRKRLGTRWGGLLAYAAGVASALRRLDCPPARLTGRAAPGSPDLLLHDGPLLMAAIGNGPWVGGGFHLAPGARLTDGHLDACLVQGASRRRALVLLPAAMRGRHIDAPEVTLRPVVQLQAAFERPVRVHVDGEVLPAPIARLEIRLEPGRLRVRGGSAG